MIVESSTLLDVDAHAHDISEFAPELAESSVSSQIFRYSFARPLIENDIEHERVESSVVISSGSSEFPRDQYSFTTVSIDSSSNESPEFLVMIQQMVSSASFSGCLGFVFESSITPSAGLDVCPPRHLRFYSFLIFRNYAYNAYCIALACCTY